MNESDQQPLPPAPNQGVVRLACYAIVALCLFATVAVISVAKNFLVPVVLAFLLSMVFGPIRRFFDRRGVPTPLSSIGIVFFLVCLFLGLFSALAVPASNWIDNAPSIEYKIQRRVAEISRSLNGVIKVNKEIKQLTDKKKPGVKKVEVKKPGMAVSAAMVAPSIIAQFVFTLVLLLFLLASGDMFYEKLVHVMPTFRDKRRAVHIAYNIERKLSRYLLTITSINAGVGLVVGLAMALLGMPSPALLGLLAFLLNFIPYLGAFAGIALVAGVALVSFDWLGWTPIAAGLYFAVTAIEGQLITPYTVGRNLRLNTVVVFVSVSFWAWLWSVIGMIVAVPLLIAVRTFCEHIDGLNGLGNFLSERGAERDDLPEDDTATN